MVLSKHLVLGMRRFINLIYNHGFTHYKVEHDLYIHHQDGKTLIIVLYVDDLFLTGHSTSMINDMKQQLKDSFEMTNLGLLHSFLGLQISQTSVGFPISQPRYTLGSQ
jgi:hypothetical protein